LRKWIAAKVAVLNDNKKKRRKLLRTNKEEKESQAQKKPGREKLASGRHALKKTFGSACQHFWSFHIGKRENSRGWLSRK